MISLPAGFIPKHIFKEDEKQQNDSNSKNDTKQQQQQQQQRQQQQQKRLSSKERSLMFGETVKTLDDVNKWTLKWDKPVGDGGAKEGDVGLKNSGDKNDDKPEDTDQKKTSRYYFLILISCFISEYLSSSLILINNDKN